MTPGIASAAGDNIISKTALSDGSYCHLKFPAIREETLASSHPILQDSDSGEIIDFYGPCDHDPLGKEEIQSQKLEHQHRFEREFSS
jgi:hypothetical protein